MADGAESVQLLCELAAERGLRGGHALRRERRPAVAPHRDAGLPHPAPGPAGPRDRLAPDVDALDGQLLRVSKLIPLIAEAGVHAVANPLINITLQGRHDTYPKRRGMTRVPELMAAGINVGFGHDCVMDPWYSLGSGDMLEVAHDGPARGADDLAGTACAPCFDAVTVNNARVLGLDGYGLEPRLPRRLRAAAGARPGRGDPPARPPPAGWCARGKVIARCAGARRSSTCPAARQPWTGRCATRLSGRRAPRRGPWPKTASLESFATRTRTRTMKLIGSLTSPYVRKVRIVMAEKKLDFQLVLEDVWGTDDDAQVQPAGQGALPGDGRRRGGVRLARHRRIPGHAVAGGQADPAAGPRAHRGAHLGGAGRRRARRRHPGAPGSDLDRPQRGAALAGLDRPPDEPRRQPRWRP